MSSIKKGKNISLDKKKQGSPKNKASMLNNDNICNDVDSTSPNSPKNVT